MFILKLCFIAAFLFGLHQILLTHGGATGAHIITGSVAFLLAIVVGLTKESFV